MKLIDVIIGVLGLFFFTLGLLHLQVKVNEKKLRDRIRSTPTSELVTKANRDRKRRNKGN